MEGVNILATITRDTVNGSFFLLLSLTFFFIFMAFMLWDKDSFLFAFLGILSFACIFIFSIETDVIYKATIDDTVTLKAIEEKYIIIDKVEDLYTLRLKENEDEQNRKN